MSILPPEIQAAIDKAAKGGKFKSLEEANEVISGIVMEYNKKAQLETAGLSPEQVYRLLHSDWESNSSVLKLNNKLKHDDLAKVPIYHNARLFMEQAAIAPIKATAAGNLNRAFVNLMMSNMIIDADYKDMVLRVNKVFNEEDVQPLHKLRVILSVSGIIRKRKGKFILSKKGKELLSDDAAGLLFAHIFKTFFRKFNLAYLDWLPPDPCLQDTIAYGFYVIYNLDDKWHAIDRLKDVFWLKAVRDEVVGSEPDDNLLRQTKSRLIKPLILFGLLNKKIIGDSSKLIKKYAVKKSKLFDQFIIFDF